MRIIKDNRGEKEVTCKTCSSIIGIVIPNDIQISFGEGPYEGDCATFWRCPCCESINIIEEAKL